MKKLVAIGFGITLILTGCVTTQGPSGSSVATTNDTPKDCNFNSIQGKEFVFRKQSPSLQKYGYMSWKKSPDISGQKLDYAGYVNKHGKVKVQVVTDKYNSKWFVAVTDSCETIYSSARSRSGQKSVDELEKLTGIYFVETLEKAKSLVGKDIWTNVPFGAKKARVLFTTDPNISYPKGNLDRLHVINIDTSTYGHTFGAVPFFLVVKTESGKEGLLPYSPKHFHESNPIKPDWVNSIVKLIKEQKIKVGMTEEQALLSWGPPQKNNKSVGSYGVHEQWVYGDGQYLYFENKVLTSFQTSQ